MTYNKLKAIKKRDQRKVLDSIIGLVKDVKYHNILLSKEHMLLVENALQDLCDIESEIDLRYHHGIDIGG